ncbi:MAG: helix-turn-helix transcriptional regulator [Solirubrobacterales bacterium]
MEAFEAEVARQVGRRIRSRRRFLDMTQEELAFRSEVHRTQFTLIERGRRQPRIHTLIRIATVLDLSPCQLLEGISWEPARPACREEGEGEDG